MKASERADERYKVAEDYVRAQLKIMDGSVDAALRRIGTDRYEQLIRDVLKALPKRREVKGQ